MGLDLWYNKGVKRERFKSERGKEHGRDVHRLSIQQAVNVP